MQRLQPSRDVFYCRPNERRGRRFEDLPTEAKLAGLMDLIANPALAAADRTRQLRRFAVIVRDETHDETLLSEWGDGMWHGGGGDLRRMVADARAGRPLAL